MKNVNYISTIVAVFFLIFAASCSKESQNPCPPGYHVEGGYCVPDQVYYPPQPNPNPGPQVPGCPYPYCQPLVAGSAWVQAQESSGAFPMDTWVIDGVWTGYPDGYGTAEAGLLNKINNHFYDWNFPALVAHPIDPNTGGPVYYPGGVPGILWITNYFNPTANPQMYGLGWKVGWNGDSGSTITFVSPEGEELNPISKEDFIEEYSEKEWDELFKKALEFQEKQPATK